MIARRSFKTSTAAVVLLATTTLFAAAQNVMSPEAGPGLEAPAPRSDGADPTATLSEQRKIEAIVRNYLLANPEIIRDAIAALQRKDEQAALELRAQSIANSAEALFRSSQAAVLGDPAGDATIVEFFDYNCGYCRRAHADMKELLANDPNLRFVLREFPILGPGSVEAARISIAVLQMAPEIFPAFHDALISEPGQIDGAVALSVAGSLGIDVDALKLKAGADEVSDVVAESHDLAAKLSLTGTPSYVTAADVIVGAAGYDALSAAIAQARTMCASSAALTC